MNWACRECGTVLLVGVAPCSHCQEDNIATEHAEVEEIMAKAHRDRAPTRFNTDPQTYDAFTLNPLPAAEGQDPNAEELPVEVDYAGLTVAALKAELDRRKAAYEAAGDEEGVEAVTYTSADKKDDLIALLETDDEETSEEDEEVN